MQMFCNLPGGFFFITLLRTLAWVTIFGVAGQAFMRATKTLSANEHYAPAVGMAIFILVSVIFGWTSGIRQWNALPVTLIIICISVFLGKDWIILTKQLGFLLICAIPIAIVNLAVLGIFGDYNTGNDTFTYLVHGQWLQSHSFGEMPADIEHHPAFSQITIYQRLGWRMGMSFLLGWVQAAGSMEWSYETYPVLATTALIAGALAIGGLSSRLSQSGTLFCGVWTVVAGIVAGGFNYGAVRGFLPQMGALTLLTVLLGTLSGLEYGKTPGVRVLLLPVLILGALGYAYSEIIPFVGLTLVIFFLLEAYRLRSCSPLVAATILMTGTLVAWNFEIARMAQAICSQSKAVVGWPINWSSFEFFCHSCGILAADGRWVFPNSLGILAGILAGALLCTTLIKIRERFPFIIYAGLLVVAFVYFRLAAANPWSIGYGQSWSQFKLANWISPAVLVLLGIGMAGLFKTRRVLCVSVMALWVLSGAYGQIELASKSMPTICKELHRPYHPLKIYEELLGNIHRVGNGTLYIPPHTFSVKRQQLGSYFLYQIPLEADWRKDDYFGGVYSFDNPSSDARWQIVPGKGPNASFLTVVRLPAATSK
jgi:hypothetical protein